MRSQFSLETPEPHECSCADTFPHTLKSVHSRAHTCTRIHALTSDDLKNTKHKTRGCTCACSWTNTLIHIPLSGPHASQPLPIDVVWATIRTAGAFVRSAIRPGLCLMLCSHATSSLFPRTRISALILPMDNKYLVPQDPPSGRFPLRNWPRTLFEQPSRPNTNSARRLHTELI